LTKFYYLLKVTIGHAHGDFSGENIHDICGLLKAYFKDLSKPVLGDERYEDWLAISGMP
jgi:hypothetical protein